MQQYSTLLRIKTNGQGLYEFTDQAQDWVRESGVQSGLLTVFCRHTSASLTIQENADPDVVLDVQDFFSALVPEAVDRYRHRNEGADDMPAHIKTVLSDVSLSIPVMDGRAVLGTWQGVFVFEHRTRGSVREIALHLMGA